MSPSKEYVAETERQLQMKTAKVERANLERAIQKRELSPVREEFMRLMAEQAMLTNGNPHRVAAVSGGSKNAPPPPQPPSSMRSQPAAPGHRALLPSPSKNPAGSENGFLHHRTLHPGVSDAQLRAKVYGQMMADRTMNSTTMLAQRPAHVQQEPASFGDMPPPPPPASISTKRSRNSEMHLAPQLQHTRPAGPSISERRSRSHDHPPAKRIRGDSPRPVLPPPQAAEHANASDLNERAREQQKDVLLYGQQGLPSNGERAVAPIRAPPVLTSSNTMSPATMPQYWQQGPPPNGEWAVAPVQTMPGLPSDNTMQAVATAQHTATSIDEHAENEQLGPTAGEVTVGREDDDGDFLADLQNDRVFGAIMAEDFGAPVQPAVQGTGAQGGLWEQSNATGVAVAGQPGVADLEVPAHTGGATVGDAAVDGRYFDGETPGGMWEQWVPQSNLAVVAASGQLGLPDLRMPAHTGGSMMGDTANDWERFGEESQPTLLVNGGYYNIDQIKRGEHQRVPAY